MKLFPENMVPQGLAINMTVDRQAAEWTSEIEGFSPASAQQLFSFAGDMDQAMNVRFQWRLGPGA